MIVGQQRRRMFGRVARFGFSFQTGSISISGQLGQVGEGESSPSPRDPSSVAIGPQRQNRFLPTIRPPLDREDRYCGGWRNEWGEGWGEGHSDRHCKRRSSAKRPSSPRPSPPSVGGQWGRGEGFPELLAFSIA